MLQKTQEAPDAGQNQNKSPEERCDPYMFEFQHTVQITLVVVAVIMIPIMLFGKPIMFKLTHGKKAKRGSTVSEIIFPQCFKMVIVEIHLII